MPHGCPTHATLRVAAAMVAKVCVSLKLRFQGSDAPTTPFVDRGPGFYHASTDGEAEGVGHSLRAFMGDDASQQPGALQEVMLHETAVAWVRYKLARCVPARPWLETPEDHGPRLKAVVAEVNREHDLESLCRQLLSRAQQVKDEDEGRIPK